MSPLNDSFDHDEPRPRSAGGGGQSSDFRQGRWLLPSSSQSSHQTYHQPTKRTSHSVLSPSLSSSSSSSSSPYWSASASKQSASCYTQPNVSVASATPYGYSDYGNKVNDAASTFQNTTAQYRQYQHPQVVSEVQHRRTSTDGVFSIIARIVPTILLLLLPWIPAKYSENHVLALHHDGFRKMQQQDMLLNELKRISEDFRKAQSETNQLEAVNHKTFQRLHTKLSPEFLASQRYDDIEKMESTILGRIDAMEEYIQQNAVAAVENSFGKGPHRVELTVREVNSQSSEGATHTMVLEMALLMEMPHAICHFLQMVDLQLWDGMSMVMGNNQADSIVAATPMQILSDDANSRDNQGGKSNESTSSPSLRWAGQRFIDSDLTQLAFGEHSSTYPPPNHYKYSVAFSSSRGPEWQIRLDDEPAQDRDGKAASTFAMVVEGREVLDKFMTRDSDDDSFMMTIETMRLI